MDLDVNTMQLLVGAVVFLLAIGLVAILAVCVFSPALCLLAGQAVAAAAALFGTAMALPYVKDFILAELPKLEQVECGEMAARIRSGNDLNFARNFIAKGMHTRMRSVSILGITSTGTMQTLFARTSPFEGALVDRIGTIAQSENMYPILLLDAERLRNTSMQFGPIVSGGPVWIYSSPAGVNEPGSRRPRIPRLHLRGRDRIEESPAPLVEGAVIGTNPIVRSNTAIFLCNEQVDYAGWELDAPMVIASNTQSAQSDTKLVNTRTSDRQLKLVEFASLRVAIRNTIVRMLNGDPAFTVKASSSDYSVQDLNSMQDAVRGDLEVITIDTRSVPAKLEPATVSPVGTPDTPPAVAGDENVVLSESVVAAAEVAFDRSGDMHSQSKSNMDVIWPKLNWGGGLLFLWARVRLDRKDLQYFLNKTFTKKGEGIQGQKKFANLNFEYLLFNPRIFFSQGKLAMQLDVRIRNKSQVPERKHNTIMEQLQKRTNLADTSTFKEKTQIRIGELRGIANSVADGARNVGRSVALSIPEEMTIRNVYVDIGNIRYEPSNGHFYLEDLNLKDFELSVGEKSFPTLGGFKPFVISSISEFLNPYLRQHPVWDLDKIRILGIPVASMVLKELKIEPTAEVRAEFKLGRVWTFY